MIRLVEKVTQAAEANHGLSILTGPENTQIEHAVKDVEDGHHGEDNVWLQRHFANNCVQQ